MEDQGGEGIPTAACGGSPTGACGHSLKEAAALAWTAHTGPYFLAETGAHEEKLTKEQVFWWELQCVRDCDGEICS